MQEHHKKQLSTMQIQLAGVMSKRTAPATATYRDADVELHPQTNTNAGGIRQERCLSLSMRRETHRAVCEEQQCPHGRRPTQAVLVATRNDEFLLYQYQHHVHMSCAMTSYEFDNDFMIIKMQGNHAI